MLCAKLVNNGTIHVQPKNNPTIDHAKFHPPVEYTNIEIKESIYHIEAIEINHISTKGPIIKGIISFPCSGINSQKELEKDITVCITVLNHI